MASYKSHGMTVDVAMLGDAELSRKLNTLQGMGRTSIVSQAGKKAMKPVLNDIKAKVPVDTGLLKKSFKARSIKAMRGRRARGNVGARILMPTREMVQIPAKAKGYYPSAQEFGFRVRGGGHVPGKRFMRDSLYGNRSQVFAIMRREMWAKIKKLMASKGMAIPEGVGE